MVQSMIDGSKKPLHLFLVDGSGSACSRMSKLLNLPSGVSVGVGSDLSETYTNSCLDGCKGIDTNIVICTPHHLLRRMFNARWRPSGTGGRPFCETVIINSGYCKNEEVDALLECLDLFKVPDVRQIKWSPKVLHLVETSVSAGTSVASSLVSSMREVNRKLHDDPRPFLVFSPLREVADAVRKLQEFTVVKAVEGPTPSRAAKRVVFVVTGNISINLPSISAVFDTGMEIIHRPGMGTFPVKVSTWTTSVRRSFSEREYVSISTRGQRAARSPEDPKMALGMKGMLGQSLTEQEKFFNFLPFGTTISASAALHEWKKRGFPLFPGVCAAVSEISQKPIPVLLEGMTRDNWKFFSWGCQETRLIGAICNALNDMKDDVLVSDNFDAGIAVDLWKQCKPKAEMIFFGLPEGETLLWDSSCILDG